jgi:hypothetical protein
MREQLKWYDKDDSSPWIALAELRQRPRVRAIASSMSRRSPVAIDQYAEKALGNRNYFSTSPTAWVRSFYQMRRHKPSRRGR